MLGCEDLLLGSGVTSRFAMKNCEEIEFLPIDLTRESEVCTLIEKSGVWRDWIPGHTASLLLLQQ